jgi:hypothetical protein
MFHLQEESREQISWNIAANFQVCLLRFRGVIVEFTLKVQKVTKAKTMDQEESRDHVATRLQ